MSYYDNPQDLIQDTKAFLASDYGKHIVSILTLKQDGHLSGAADIDTPYPERYAAKYSAVKEVLDLIYSPLDDDIPSHG
jgi:hypothetical protein